MCVRERERERERERDRDRERERPGLRGRRASITTFTSYGSKGLGFRDALTTYYLLGMPSRKMPLARRTCLPRDTQPTVSTPHLARGLRKDTSTDRETQRQRTSLDRETPAESERECERERKERERACVCVCHYHHVTTTMCQHARHPQSILHTTTMCQHQINSSHELQSVSLYKIQSHICQHIHDVVTEMQQQRLFVRGLPVKHVLHARPTAMCKHIKVIQSYSVYQRERACGACQAGR